MIQNALIGIIIALVLATGYKTYEAHNLKATIATLEQTHDYDQEVIEGKNAVIEGWEKLAKTDRETIDKLAKKNAELVGQKQDVARAEAIASDNLARTRAQLNTANRQLTEARRTLYASDPTCSVLSVTPVCAGVGISLRTKWRQAQLAVAATAGVRGGVDIGAVRPDWRQPAGDAAIAGLATTGYLQPDRLYSGLLLPGAVQRSAGHGD